MTVNENTSGNELGVAIIAGIAPGLGNSLRTQLLERGYRVVGLARSEKMNDGTENYTHISCDLADSKHVSEVINQVENDMGPIKVLICNAHQLFIKSLMETQTDDLESVWRNSCLGAMNAAHAAIPLMLERKTGTIIFTGATASIRGGAKFAAFASAKFALRGFAQALAREFIPQGLHIVHTILDGLIWEEQTIERFNPSQDACMDPNSLAKSYLQIIDQNRSAWSHEVDFRPFSENF